MDQLEGMLMARWLGGHVLVAALLVVGACSGGGAPAPHAPVASAVPLASSSASVARPAADAGGTDLGGDAKSAKPPSAKPSEPSPSVPETPTAKPRDVITQSDVVFLLAFDASDAGKEADEKCTASSGQDPARLAACKAKAREKIQVDAMRFVKDTQNRWWWHGMQKRNNTLLILHKVMFEFGDETDRTIAIKPIGTDQGMTPFGQVPRALRFDVINEYSIATRDPLHGKLVYEGRIGIAAK